MAVGDHNLTTFEINQHLKSNHKSTEETDLITQKRNCALRYNQEIGIFVMMLSRARDTGTLLRVNLSKLLMKLIKNFHKFAKNDS